MRKLSTLAEAVTLLGLGLLVVLGVRQWLGVLHQAAGTDTTAACADNLRRLEVAVVQYTQANDEVFPPMQNAQVFQAALLPFVKDPTVFRCPATGLPYTPNAALSQVSYPSITADIDTVPVVQDSTAHADGLSTVVFLDGHVEYGGVEVGDPVVILTGREKSTAIAILEYMQDNNETFPPMHTPQELQAAVYPYVHSHRIFIAPNGQPFVPNAALSGVHLVSVADPAATVLLQDQSPYPDGVQTIAYADGRLERGGIEYGDPNVMVVSRAKQLALAMIEYIQDADEVFPPMQNVPEFQAALLPFLGNNSRILFNTNGQPFVPNSALSGVSLASIADPSVTVLFQDTAPYTRGFPTTAYLDGHVTHVAAPPHTHVLWTNTDGRLSLWNYDTIIGAYTHQEYGPYSGWMAKAIADGPDGKVRVLWTKADGTMSLWSLDDASGVYAHHEFGPYAGWTAGSISADKGNTTHILWDNTDGRLSLWNYDATGGTFTQNTYGAYPGWTAVGIADGPDGRARVLWDNTSGAMSLWSLDNTAGVFSHSEFGVFPGWTAGSASVGSNNLTHVLWTNLDGRLSLWNYDAAAGTYTHHEYGPYSGWSVKSVADSADGKARVLWDNTSGAMSLWGLDNTAGVYSHYEFGPFAGWTAAAVSAGT